MTAFEQALMGMGSDSRSVQPRDLKLLAKQASALYGRGGTSLNDAVVDVLRDQNHLGPEHVRRVVEFANQFAFDDAFKKEAGDHRVVNFEQGPADPAFVSKELRMNPDPIQGTTVLSPPQGYVPGYEGAESRYGGQTKTASAVSMAPYAQAEPGRNVVELWETLNSARDQLQSELNSIENDYNVAVDSLYKEARDVLSDGHSPADVSSVVASAAPDVSFTKLALKLISRRMEEEGVPAARNITKTASPRMANDKHPLYQATRGFVKVASARFTHVAALERITAELSAARRLLQEVIQ